MRVLLINSNQFKQPWPVIPFGLCCVAAATESAGHRVKVLDLCFSQDSERDICHAIKTFSPHVVGVSIRNIDNGVGYNPIFLLDDVKRSVIAALKSLFHGPIVLGGPAVGINGPEILQFMGLEYAIKGDGEEAFVRFLDSIEAQTSLDSVPGLVRARNGCIVSEREPARVADLNALPQVSPSRYVDVHRYARFNSPLQIQTKRGCPLNCVYCTYNHIEGRQYRLRRPEKVAEEIERLVHETGIRKVEFTDSTFNLPLRHAKAVLKELIKKNMDLDLRTMGLNPGAVDEELADLMKAAGFREVDLGAEAGCDQMLRSLGKNYTASELLKAGAILRTRGIPTTWYLLLGAPGETETTVKKTFETINKAAHQWDLVNIAVGMRVYKGAPIAEAVAKTQGGTSRDGFLSPTTFPDSISLSPATIKRLAKEEARKRPNYFMYDEDETTPPWLLSLGALLLRVFAKRQPLWRLFILRRRLENLFGKRARL